MSLALAVGDAHTAIDISEYDAMSLDSLSEHARREHDAARDGVNIAIRHAIRCGEMLIAAKGRCPRGEWWDWLESAGIATSTSQVFMRMARFQEHVLEAEPSTMVEARASLLGLPIHKPGPSVPEYVVEKARAMRADGMSYRAIGDALGVKAPTVNRWCWDETKKRQKNREAREKKRRKDAESRAARKALKRQERDLAMKKMGGSVAECNSLIKKLAQELDRTCADATDTEIRAELTAALSDLYKVEDRIVRALGIE